MGKVFYCVIIAITVSCARVMPPSGGDRDQDGPRVVETDPVQNLMAMNFSGTNRPVRIIFDETISERSPREMVQVSPETGEIHVDRDGNVLEVTIEGGWQEGRVYRVSVLPGLLDRHGNARAAPFELVFSTGAAMLRNALGGIATDRITGRPVASARVEARAESDSAVYTAVSDTSGFFSMRSLPAGTYTTLVYVDQNRNRRLDNAEARASQQITVGATDTLTLELALLGTDTTPARLLRAEIRDSVQVRLTFDDYMEANAPIGNILVTAYQLPDSTPIPAGRLMTPRGFQTLRGDTTRVTSPRVPAAPVDTTRVLPINELVWVSSQPLRPGTRYRFTATGYLNLHGLPNGGGSATATAPAPPRAPPPAARDTTPAPRDTTARR